MHKLAHAFRQAFADRFTYLGDPDFSDVPLEAMISKDYLRLKADRFVPTGSHPPLLAPGTSLACRACA